MVVVAVGRMQNRKSTPPHKSCSCLQLLAWESWASSSSSSTSSHGSVLPRRSRRGGNNSQDEILMKCTADPSAASRDLGHRRAAAGNCGLHRCKICTNVRGHIYNNLVSNTHYEIDCMHATPLLMSFLTISCALSCCRGSPAALANGC